MFIPRNEQGVVVLFAETAQVNGWEFTDISVSFPDAILSKNGELWNTEFEFLSSNFLEHKHDHRRCDLIVCWRHDYPECPIPVIELSTPGTACAEYKKCDPRDKEIEYWRQRALRAEGENKTLQRKLTFRVNEPLPDESTDSASKRLRAIQLVGEGLSQTQVANEIGVHRNTISAWLRGTNGQIVETEV